VSTGHLTHHRRSSYAAAAAAAAGTAPCPTAADIAKTPGKSLQQLVMQLL
jgi:hypothetical protein